MPATVFARSHTQQHSHHGADDEDRQQQALRRRVVHACVGIADEHEQRKPDDDDARAQHLPPHDVLGGQPVPERQRPDDRRDEQRLDDDELAAIQRRPLRRVSEQQDDGPEQPDRNGEQPHEPAHALDRIAATCEGELPALLQRGREREARPLRGGRGTPPRR